MMIDPDHNRLSIRRQCELVSISRASFYRQPAGETPENLELMRIIDGAFMEMPWYGSRQMARHLRRQGWYVGRKRVRRLMRKIGLSPIYQPPKTSEPHPQHRIYPYLLRHLAIERPDQVWCADVTYIPMRRGSSTSSPSWTGSAARFWPGGSAIRWTSSSASKPWRKR
jgi:putative transposase